jgi:hypothetical protein
MTLADIDVWTENWLEQTGRQRLIIPNGSRLGQPHTESAEDAAGDPFPRLP